ncbi:MAG: hypothetical protein GXP31_07840, partial [Kiritimatiellaeota bacterium]|nr:hypothetical protein [Kiritimatiellota bacterium]
DFTAKSGIVANLYNRALAHRVADFVLTWEEDVCPESPNAIRKLSDRLAWRWKRIDAAAGLYQHPRRREGLACISRSADRWDASYTIDALRGQFRFVGMIPAGFTLWRGGPLARVLPVLYRHRRAPIGWDALVSAALQARGGRVAVDGNVFCRHEWQT